VTNQKFDNENFINPLKFVMISHTTNP